MRILVTGASGFLGSRLVNQLAGMHDVIAVSRAATSVGGGVQTVVCDLGAGFDAALLPDRVDCLIHLAQSRRYREFPEGADDMFAVNVLGTHNLLEYARASGTRHFVMASSGSVYAPSMASQDEDAQVAPQDFYGASKLAAENLLRPYRAFMTVAALRLFYLYGPGQTDKLVAGLIARIRGGKALQIPGSSDGIRLNPTYIDDAVAVIAQAAEQGWDGVCNVAGPETVSIRELGQAIAIALGVRVDFEMSGGADPVSVLPDLSRLGERVDVSSFVGLKDGLRKMTMEGT